MRLKLGDLVELNYAGKGTQWLYQARGKIGVLTEMCDRQLYKEGAAYISWIDVPPPEYWGYLNLNKVAIPLYCLKKVRRKKK
jgi:hypothetical protein